MNKSWLAGWKYPLILLFGIGLSNIGAWIYFIALNLIILNMTQSPLALSILYMIRPLAGLLANIWSGSLVDRINKKKAMVALDFFRAALLCILPFTDSVFVIYLVTFFVQLASHIFGNASFTYITKLIPEAQRPRFNSLNSLLNSGAFIIGPAIAGMLFIVGTPMLAIIINIAALLVSGIITLFIPNVESFNFKREGSTSMLSLKLIKEDFQVVKAFYKQKLIIFAICLSFGGLMVVMATAVDSLEASFATIVLKLSEADYGFLVSVAGIGMAIGAIVNVAVVKLFTPTKLIIIGVLGNTLGYCLYAFSYSFFAAGAGFFILAFFLSFANTGFMTLYQKHIPTDIMGRIGAFNGLIESILIIIVTTIFGFIADLGAIRPVIITGTLFMFILALYICKLCLSPLLSKTKNRNTYK